MNTPKTLLALTAISGTTPQTSAALVLQRGGGASLQLMTTGTVAGAWTIHGSNKPGADVDGDANASDVTAAFKTGAGDALAAAAGAATSQMVQAGPIYFKYLWAKFTPTSGAGNVGAYGNEVEEV